MGGKTLTRADLAEAVVRKVGLPRNESQELVELVLNEISDSLSRGEQVKLVVVRLVRHSPEGRARRPQSEDRQGGSDHASPRSCVPPQQHHERPDQLRSFAAPEDARLSTSLLLRTHTTERQIPNGRFAAAKLGNAWPLILLSSMDARHGDEQNSHAAHSRARIRCMTVVHEMAATHGVLNKPVIVASI